MPTNDAPPEQGTLQEHLSTVQDHIARGRYQQARNLCERLLIEYPRSAELHAAMGDVCSAQEAWSEAVNWYELALELDFDPAVMERLARARSQTIRGGPEVSRVSEPQAPPLPAERHVHRQQAIGLSVAAVVLISLFAFLLIRATNQTRATEAEARATPTAAPREMAARPPGGALPSRPTTPPSPAFTPQTPAPTTTAPAPTTRPMVRYTGQPPMRSPSSPSSPGWAGAAGAGQLATSSERRILRRMHMEKWQQGTTVSKIAVIAVDDYSGAGILTISAPRTSSANRLERDVVIAAFRAALSAMRADPALTDLVVRCVSRLKGEQGADEDIVVFRARVTRDALKYWLGKDEMPSFGQIKTSLLTDVRWNRSAVARHLKKAAAAAHTN